MSSSNCCDCLNSKMYSAVMQKIQGLQTRLMNSDIFEKSHLCDEYLQILEGEDFDINEITSLYSFIAPFLIDLNREQDLQKCISVLNSNPDYHAHLHAIMIQVTYYDRKNDSSRCIQLYDEGIKIAETNQDVEAIAEGHYMKGKEYCKQNKPENALECLERAISFAEELHNYNLIATCKYYIGIELLALGHDELALEKLREASDESLDQGSKAVIKHAEIIRAYQLLKNNKGDVAVHILSDWFETFKMDV